MKDRKRIRLKDFDYTQNGCYFITICTQNRVNWFGKIVNSEMCLNEFGKIAAEQWLWLAEQYEHVVDQFVIMPNHFHGIIALTSTIRNGHDRSLQKPKSIPSLIGAFKTTSSKKIHLNGNIKFKWQKSFHDRIIRNDKELTNIQTYIYYNPLKWQWDIENRKHSAKERDDYYEKIFTSGTI